MFDKKDRAEGGSQDSLFSLARAIDEERARTAAPAHEDAAARHRRARAMREAYEEELIRQDELDAMSAAQTVEPRQPPPRVEASPPREKARAAPVKRLRSTDNRIAAAAKGKRFSASQAARRDNWRKDNTETAPARPDLSRGTSRADSTQPRAGSDRRDDYAAEAAVPRPTAVKAPQPASEPMMVVERGGNDSWQQYDGWQPLIDPVKVVGGILNSKSLIAGTTILGAVLGIVIAFSTPKKYEAYAEIEVSPLSLKLVDRDLTDTNGLSADATLALVENNVRLLRSGTVLGKVVEKLNLESDAEFNGQNDGIAINPLNLLRSLLTGSDGASDPARRRAMTIQNVAEAVSIDRTGKTFTILIGANTEDGKKSALIANTLVKEFTATVGKRQADQAGRATDELTGRLDTLRKEVDTAERKIETYKAEHDIIDAQGRLITDDDILKLNDQLATAKARTLELSSRADSTRKLDANSVLNGSMPEAATSGVITDLRGQYAVAKQETERLAVRLGPRHPQLQAAQAQLAGLREQIATELSRLASQVQEELRRAVKLEQELAARLAQLKVGQGDKSNEMVALRELEREANAKRSIYEQVLIRARETGEQKDINTANISIISDAQPPLEPSGQSRVMIAGLGGLLGLLAGIGIGGGRGALESLRETSGGNRRRTAIMRKPAGEDVSTAPRQPSPQPVYDMPQMADAPAQEAPKSARETSPPQHSNPSGKPPEDHMHPYYPMPGYPQQAAPSYAPQPIYAPPQQAYPQQPVYAQPPMPPAYAPPYPQAAYPASPYPQPQPYQPPMPPQAWTPQYTAQPAPQPVYPPYAPMAYPAAPTYAPPPHYAQPQQTSQPQPSDSQDSALSEIKDSIREFSNAVRDLTEGRMRRRYF